MAKKPTLSTIASGYASVSPLNSNFTAIRDQFDLFLSRDGSTPNHMLADFDMNSNDILNAGDVFVDNLFIDGVPVSILFAESIYNYDTRTQLVNAAQSGMSLDNGAAVIAGGLVYTFQDGATAISDIPDFIPGLEVYVDHFGTNTTPGTTDMTTAIQDAVDYLISVGGGSLHFKNTHYLIGDTVYIEGNVELVGTTPSFKNDYLNGGLVLLGSWVRATTGMNKNLFTVRHDGSVVPAGNYPRTHAGFKSLGVYGNRSSNPSPTSLTNNNAGSGIHLFGVSYVDIEDVIVLRCAEHGIFAETSDDDLDNVLFCNNITIKNTVSLQNGSDGFRLFGGDSIISNVVAGYNGRDGYNGSMGPIFGLKSWNNRRYGATLQTFGLSLTNSDIYDNGSTGVRVESGSGHVIDGNRIFDNGRDPSNDPEDRTAIFIAAAAGTVVASNNNYAVQYKTKRVADIGSITGGSGYVDGTYTNVPLTGGSGSGAAATVVVSGGAVTEVTFDPLIPANRGGGYTVGNTLSASNTNLGGSGSGFSVPITVLGRDFTTEYGGTGDMLYGISAPSGVPKATIVGSSFDGVTPYNITDTTSCTFDHFTFGTRTALVAAASGLPSGAVARVRSLQWIKDGGTSISDMSGWSPVEPVHLDHWRTATSAAAGDAAFVQAIAWFNVGNRQLALPEGQVSISAPIPAITATLGRVEGNATRLTMVSGSSGSFLVLGDGSTAATRVSLTGVALQCNNTPNENDFAIDFRNATQCDADIVCINVASVFRAGRGTASGEKAQQCVVRLRGNFNKGLNADANILLENYANLVIDPIMSGAGVSNTNASGALMRIKPGTAAPCDTLRLMGTMQSFSVSTPGSADGKPYGLVIDLTDNTVTNIFCDAHPVFDHTTTAALYVFDGVASTGTSRDLNLIGLRLATDNGRVVHIDKNSAGTVRWVGWKITDGHFDVVSNSNAVEITGDGWDACRLAGNSVVSTSATAKTRAMLIDSDGWTVKDNTIGPNTTSAGAFATGIEVTNTAITELTILDNPCDPSVTLPVKVPTWATAAAPRRVIGSPGVVPLAYYAKAALPATQSIGAMIWVTDDVGGATPAFFDGTNWRRFADRNIIS